MKLKVKKQVVSVSSMAAMPTTEVRICPLSGRPCRCPFSVARECPCAAMAKALKAKLGTVDGVELAKEVVCC